MVTKRSAAIATIWLAVSAALSSVYAQNVVSFDIAQRRQILDNLETYSEVHMYHWPMAPLVNDLVNVVRAPCYNMAIKQDVESVNDNDDPEVTNWATIDPWRAFIGGNGGHAMGYFFPFLRACKKTSDSLFALDPTFRRFALNIMGGVSDRFVPSWLKVSDPGTSQIDSTRYAEMAEHMYIQIKLYKDSTGLDVGSICPLTIGNLGYSNYITPTNLAKLMGTVGTYLEARDLHPELAFGHGMFLGLQPANQPLFLQYITTVFNDPVASRYVKRVIVENSYSGGSISDAFAGAVADSAEKYGFEVTINYMNQSGHPAGWTWSTIGQQFAADLPRMLNLADASNIMLVYHANFELGLSISMVYDTIPNGDLNDPVRALTRKRTEQFHVLGHLFSHTHSGATYVLNSSSTNPDVKQAVLYDTINGATTVLLVNNATSSRTIDINCSAYDPGTYQVFRLSATEIDARLPAVTSLTGIELPARSATFLTNGYVAGDVVATVPLVVAQRTALPATLPSYMVDLCGRLVPAGLVSPERLSAGLRVVPVQCGAQTVLKVQQR